MRPLLAGFASRRYGPTAHPSNRYVILEEHSMADDLKQTGRQDDARINPEQEHELDYWSGQLGVSRDELRKVVQAAGPMVKDVKRHLGRGTDLVGGQAP
jgi:hypothetical protein